MEDIIETLLGLEIMDESDNIEDMQLQARKNWERRAKRMGIEINRDIELERGDDEQELWWLCWHSHRDINAFL